MTMANLTRYDPFGDMDDLFKGFMLRPVRFEQQMPQIKMDVKENDGAYVVHAEIPGVKKEDIKIDVDGNTVSISAEVKQEKEEKKGERVIRSERYYGSVSRSFSLGHDVDEAKAQARYADGVLELTLPKKSGAQPSKITVT
jgi:HSP20 family protein